MLVRVLYKTDHHHSYNSRDMIGIFSSKVQFEKAIKKIITEQCNSDELTENIDWHIGFFLEKKQTQGLPNFELVSEDLQTNKIF